MAELAVARSSLGMANAHSTSLVPAGHRSEFEQHAVSGHLRPILRPLVSRLGLGTPDSHDRDPREAGHPVLIHGWALV